MNFDYIRDPQWKTLDEKKRQWVLNRAFERDIVSDPEFTRLDQPRREYVQNQYLQRALNYEKELYPEPEQPDSVFSAASSGLSQTWNALKTAGNVLLGRDERVMELANDPVQQTKAQEAFLNDLAAGMDEGDRSLADGIRNTWGAVKRNPRGALHMMVSQLPNSGVVMGTMGAGALAGLPFGPVGSVVGAGLGLLFGNSAIETGFMAQEKAHEGEYDRDEALRKGLTKGSVISLFDAGAMAVTGGLAKGIYGPAAKAMSQAAKKTLADAGIDVASKAAVAQAMATPSISRAVSKAVLEAGIKNAPSKAAVASTLAGGLSLDMLSEGLGEYYGTLAADEDASPTEAVLEGSMALGQSGPQTAVAFMAGRRSATRQQRLLDTLNADQALTEGNDAALNQALDDALDTEWNEREAQKQREAEARRSEADRRVQPPTADQERRFSNQDVIDDVESWSARDLNIPETSTDAERFDDPLAIEASQRQAEIDRNIKVRRLEAQIADLEGKKTKTALSMKARLESELKSLIPPVDLVAAARRRNDALINELETSQPEEFEEQPGTAVSAPTVGNESENNTPSASDASAPQGVAPTVKDSLTVQPEPVQETKLKVSPEQQTIIDRVDKAVNDRARTNVFMDLGKEAVPGLRMQEHEEAGRWVYQVAKGEVGQADFDAQIEQWRKENRVREPEAETDKDRILKRIDDLMDGRDQGQWERLGSLYQQRFKDVKAAINRMARTADGFSVQDKIAISKTHNFDELKEAVSQSGIKTEPKAEPPADKDQSVQPDEMVQPDILAKAGKPFASKGAAVLHIKRAKADKTHEPVQAEGGWVGRAIAQNQSNIDSLVDRDLIEVTGQKDKTVSVDMPEKQANALNPKEQKAYLLKEIDVAIKSASEKTRPYTYKTDPEAALEGFEKFAKEVGTVTISIPGDGEYTVLNTKEALNDLKKRASSFPASDVVNHKIGLSPAPTKPTGKRITGFSGESIRNYKPSPAPDFIPASRKGASNFYGNGFFSNGSYAVKMEKPKVKGELKPIPPGGESLFNITDKDFVEASFGKEIYRNDQDQNAELEIPDDTTLVHIKSDNTSKDGMYMSEQVDSILKHHPKAVPHFDKKQSGKIVFFMESGELVGVVGPVVNAKVPEVLKSSGVKFQTLQPSPEYSSIKPVQKAPGKADIPTASKPLADGGKFDIIFAKKPSDSFYNRKFGNNGGFRVQSKQDTAWAIFDNNGKLIEQGSGSSSPGKRLSAWSLAIEEAINSELNQLPSNIFIRFGNIPKGGVSQNWSSGKRESGLSVYGANKNLNNNTVWFDGQGDVGAALMSAAQGRKAYLVSGNRVGKGSDGEPIIKNVKIISELSLHPDKTIDGFVLASPNPSSTPGEGVQSAADKLKAQYQAKQQEKKDGRTLAQRRASLKRDGQAGKGLVEESAREKFQRLFGYRDSSGQARLIAPLRKDIRQLQDIVKAFGKEAYFFTTKDSGLNNTNGFTNPESGNEIFINANATDPLISIAGHELIHQLKYNHPDLYDFLLNTLRVSDDNFKKYVEDLNSGREDFQKVTDPENQYEEFIGDFAADQFPKVEFWSKMLNENAPLTMRIIKVLQKILDKIKNIFVRSEVYVSNFEESQDALAYAMSEAMRRHKTTTGQAGSDLMFQTAYHGTPHVWPPEPGFPHGRPRLDKIGTGEGAAAYGWGFYTADLESTGRTYQENLSRGWKQAYTYKGKTAEELYESAKNRGKYGEALVWEGVMLHGTKSSIRTDLKEKIDGGSNQAKEGLLLLEKLPENLFAEPTGALYKLDIPDNVLPKLLDWDRPLSGSMLQKIAKLPEFDAEINNGRVVSSNGGLINGNPTGEQVYRVLERKMGDKAASEYLASIGIPGNRYLDGMSRDKGEGSYNYVIWDQKVLDQIALLERNSEVLEKMQADYQTGQRQGEPVTIEDVQALFPGQQIFMQDGKLSIRFKNGQGITIEKVDFTKEEISMAINSGRMTAKGKILGTAVGNEIKLNRKLADRFTLKHEVFHTLENLGIITKADQLVLQGAYLRLKKANKLTFTPGTSVENRANIFAQLAEMRESERGTLVGKVVQKIKDFIDALVNYGQMTERKLMREVESGKIYSREVNGESLQVLVPQYEQTAAEWYSQMRKVLDSKLNAGPAAQIKSQIEAWAKKGEFKQEELEWSGVLEWLDGKEGRVTKDEVLAKLDENQVRIEEVVKGQENAFDKIPDEYTADGYYYNGRWRDEKIDISEDAIVIGEDEDQPIGFKRVGNILKDYDGYYWYLYAEDIHFSEDMPTPGNVFGEGHENDETKYSQYQEPGGENYKEVLLTLPNPELDRKYKEGLISKSEKLLKEYSSSHFDETNILVHIRMNERTGPDGERVLFLEEVQSDWHQEGRKKGYGLNDSKDEFKIWLKKESERKRVPFVYSDDIAERIYQNESAPIWKSFKKETTGVPDAPFKKTWPTLALKRMARYAAENGFDKIAWTPGDVQAKRYKEALRKAVDRVEWVKTQDGIQLIGYKDGKQVVDTVEKENEVSDAIGKSMGDSIIADKNQSGFFEGDDITISDTGMAGFYDKILPAEANKFFNKAAWGKAKVDQMNLDGMTAWTLPITQEMKSKALREGMPLFQTTDDFQTSLDTLIEDPPKVDSMFRDVLKGRIDSLFASASDRLRRTGNPVAVKLGDAVDTYFDRAAKRAGKVNDQLSDIISKTKKQDYATFKEVWQHLDNGRQAEANRIMQENPVVSELVNKVMDVFDSIGTENQTVQTPNGQGMKVYDPKAVFQRAEDGQGAVIGRVQMVNDQETVMNGSRVVGLLRDIKTEPGGAVVGGWRLIGKIPRGKFWPRMLKIDVQRTLQDPLSNPQLWEELVDALIENGNIQERSEALKWKASYFADSFDMDFFAGIEKARGEKLPEIFYDYSFDAFTKYVRRWSDRISQVEQFGQKTSPCTKDMFEQAIAVAADRHTRNYIGALSERVYRHQDIDSFHQALNWLNLLATGLQLGNPVTATLNFVGGSLLNTQMFGARILARAFKDMATDWKRLQKQGIELGILRKDLLNIVHDAEAQGSKYFDDSGIITKALAKFTDLTMKYGGYMVTENFIRTHAMVAGRIMLKDALTAWNANPTSSASLKYRAKIEGNNIDVDALIRENGQGEMTDKYLRKMVNVPQGSYRVDQVPIYVDTPVGRFLFKYQKFSTQVSRMFWQNHLRPFIAAIGGGEKLTVQGKEARVRRFMDLLKYFGYGAVGGSIILAARGGLFGSPEPPPDLDELAKALENDDMARFWGLTFSKAFHAWMASGAFGFFGNYIQGALDVSERHRFKSPIAPPGLAPFEMITETILRLTEQGKLTARDMDEITSRGVSFYRGYKRGAATALEWTGLNEARLEMARRDKMVVGRLARQYEKDTGMRRKTSNTGRFGKNERSPLNQSIYEALILGDAETARKLRIDALKKSPLKDRKNLLLSMKTSASIRQPVNIGGRRSATEKQRFFAWAKKNLPEAKYKMVLELDRNYTRTARRAGLM